jgi:predicted dehydrogenase
VNPKLRNPKLKDSKLKDPKLKVGQIGVGNFGAYRRDRMRETGLFELVAAYDHNPEFLKQAQKQDGAQPCNSYDELLSTPGLEAVVISTGAKFHCEQALAAMQRGLHVFIEKPLCATPSEVNALLDAQKQSGVVVGVGHTDHSSEKHSRHIKAIIDSGVMGTIVAVEATTCHSGGFQIQPGDWRGDAEKNPGGMLFQCGVHKLHELMFYCGPISKASAMMRYDANSNTQTADAAICNLQFASGVLGSLNAYHVTPYKHYVYIYGTKKNLYLENYTIEGSRLLEQDVAPNLSGALEPVLAVAVFDSDDLCGNIRSWYHAIRDGAPLYPSLQDGARAVAVVFAAEEATRRDCAVKIPDFS